MKTVGKYILEQTLNKELDQQKALVMLKELQEVQNSSEEDIAVIGMSCRLPMADNKEEFWENLINGRNCFTIKPKEKLLFEEVYRNPSYAELMNVKHVTDQVEKFEEIVGPFVKDIDKFDAAFFGIPPREAKYMDPVQRVFLEMSWSAIEDAGYGIQNIKDTMTGVFVGKDNSNSLNYKCITEDDPMKLTGTWEGILASRISYLYNLRGPAMVIDTACSSGLVAVHEACNALKNKECLMAIAGGVSIGAGGMAEDENGREKESGAMDTVTSNDNKVRTFDKKCSGSVFGEGVVVFLLKPMQTALRDRDNIYAVIKGSAINNDGASNGITAPNPLAQAEVIQEAWKRADINPETISYVEAHGTGTLLGDPIEIIGLTHAFSKYTTQKQFCGIGSCKTNIGHLVAASGCASLLKVILSMRNHMIPPSIHFEEPNPNIEFLNSPMYVVDTPTVWKSDNGLLRAGINAFGFSGTNCHVIVEEAPVRKEHASNNKNNILALSAKTESAMWNIVLNYRRYLQYNQDIDIDDLCYTANTGRGHYEYRMAFIVKDMEDLKKKICLLIENGIDNYSEEQIYFGKNKIVSDKRKQLNEYEITERELSIITLELRRNISAINIAESVEAELYTICSLYVRGANMDWNLLYKKDKYNKIPLPVYPFDRISYWGDPKVTKIEMSDAETDKKNYHPLIGKKLAESVSQNIYSVEFCISDHWMLKEHKILGSNIVPGTTYIEIFKEVCTRYFGSKQINIKELTFLTPLSVGEGEKIETHIILSKKKDYVDLTVASKRGLNGEDTWVVHAEGRAEILTGIPVDEFQFNKITAIEEKECIIFDIPEDENSDIVYMGPRWHCVENIYKLSEEELVCQVKVQDRYGDDFKHYKYHPAMTDAVINIPIQVYMGQDIYLPLSYKNLKIYADIPEQFCSKIDRIHEKGKEVLKFNITLADMDGNILAEIEEYTTKKVNKFNDFAVSNFYNVVWKENPFIMGKEENVEGNIIVFVDKSGMADRVCDHIKNNNNRLFFVKIEEKFQKIDNTNYIISAKEEDYDRLIMEMGLKSVAGVYHFGTIEMEKKKMAYNEYERTLDTGLYSIWYLCRALLRNVTGRTDIVLLTDHAYKIVEHDKYVKPLNASFLSLGKTIVHEFQNITIRSIDIDENVNDEIIYKDLTSDGKKEFRCAYRNGKRYTEVLEAAEMTESFQAINIKSDGIYLITGGMGGIGIEMARYLAMNGKCKICLLGRSRLPEKVQWENVIIKNENKKQCRVLRGIQEIEKLGALVEVCNGDVSNRIVMEQILKELRNKYGKINGVFHCAGVAGDGFLFNKSLEVFNQTIFPKIYGTKIIDDLTKADNLDFFVLFSSMQTIFGGPGQGDYTAANSFLNEYANYMIADGRNATTVNWPGWSETGMAVDYNVEDAVTLFRSITNKNAMFALDTILSHKMTNVVPSSINMEFLLLAQNALPLSLSEDIQRSLNRYEVKYGSDKKQQIEFDINDLLILGKDMSEYSDTEKAVAVIYAKVLNLPEIDIYESFNSMGGDSIVATEVLNILNDNFGGFLNISDMFTYACVEEMANYIDSKQNLKSSEENSIQKEESYSDVIEKFESGDIDVDAMIGFFDEEIEKE